MSTATEVKGTRRFTCDRWHQFGWQVKFTSTVQFSPEKVALVTFSGVGQTKKEAIENALQLLNNPTLHSML